MGEASMPFKMQIRASNAPLKRFLFVITTTKREVDRVSLPFFLSVNRIVFPPKYSVDVSVFFENTVGLSERYNSILDDKDNEKYDYICFIHDDLWINDVFILDKIDKCSSSFDLIGTCGGKGWVPQKETSKPMIWTTSSKDAGMSGFMIHSAKSEILGKDKKLGIDGRMMFATSYGMSPSRVLTIDGNFICFTKKAISAHLRFDTDFRFHFYDIDVSFRAYAKGLTTGTAPICVTHDSLGLSVSQPEFMESQKKFLSKWF